MSKGEQNSRFVLSPILSPVDVTVVGPCLLVASHPVEMSLSQFFVNFDLHKLLNNQTKKLLVGCSHLLGRSPPLTFLPAPPRAGPESLEQKKIVPTGIMNAAKVPGFDLRRLISPGAFPRPPDGADSPTRPTRVCLSRMRWRIPHLK